MGCMLNTETKTHETNEPGSTKNTLQDILASIAEALARAAKRRDTEVAARTASKTRAAISSRNTTDLEKAPTTALVSGIEMAGPPKYEMGRIFTLSDLDAYRRRPRTEPNIKDPVNFVIAKPVESIPMGKKGKLSLDEEGDFDGRLRILSGHIADTITAPVAMPSISAGCNLLEKMRAELSLSPSRTEDGASAIPQNGNNSSGLRDVLGELSVNTMTSKSVGRRAPSATGTDRVSELDRMFIELIKTESPKKTKEPVVPVADTHDTELARIRAELGIDTETREMAEHPVIPKADTHGSELARMLVELGIKTEIPEKTEGPVIPKADTHDTELARLRAELGIGASSQNVVKHTVVFKDPSELRCALNELDARSYNGSALHNKTDINANDDPLQNNLEDPYPLFSDSTTTKYEPVGTHKNHLYTFIVNNRSGEQAQAILDKENRQFPTGFHYQDEAHRRGVDERGKEHRGTPVQRKADDKRLAHRVFVSNIPADAGERDVRMAFFDFGLKKGAVKFLPIRNAVNRTQMAYMDLRSREDAIEAAEVCRFIFGLMVHVKLGMEKC